jgi:hypothetical protein
MYNYVQAKVMELGFQATGVGIVTSVNCQMAGVKVYCSDIGVPIWNSDNSTCIVLLIAVLE